MRSATVKKTIFICVYMGSNHKKSSPETAGQFQSNLLQILFKEDIVTKSEWGHQGIFSGTTKPEKLRFT
jgi:hypothetical protein